MLANFSSAQDSDDEDYDVNCDGTLTGVACMESSFIPAKDWVMISSNFIHFSMALNASALIAD